MEESKASQGLKPPSTAAETLHSNPNPPPPPNSSLPLNTKKRPLDSYVHSNYFKMRAIVKDLRPHVIEVLKTPDFRNSKASHEIKEKLKVLMDLYKNIDANMVSPEKFGNELETQSKPDGSCIDKKLQQPRSDRKHEELSKNISLPSGIASDKQQVEHGKVHGTYVVGGSAFGWNFITFSSKESVYYGVTKEQFRSGKSSIESS